MRLWLAAAASILAPLVIPAQASATGLSCGDVVTNSTVLRHDLVDCPGHGLVIGASGITINLNGHTIDGDNPSDIWEGAGVYVPAQHRSVTVRNGTITQFSLGVHLDGSSRNTIRNLRLTDNVNGVEVTAGASRNVLKKLHLDRNKNAGVRLLSAHGNMVRHNRFTQSQTGYWAIALERQSDHNRLVSNRIEGSSDRRGGGIELGAGERNIALRNRIEGRYWGIGQDGKAIDNVIARNRVTTGGIGITVSSASSGTILTRNRTSRNLFDGINVGAGAANTTLIRNRADNNGGWGIIANAPVVDGGKNRAKGNGQAEQCLGIACR